MRCCNWKRMRYSGLFGMLVLLVSLASGCSNTTEISSSTGYPKGRGWEMINSEENIFRKVDFYRLPGEGEILSRNVSSTVRLTADRRYEDNELLRIAKSVVQFERHRSISRVNVEFVCPDCDKSGIILLSEVIARVYWEWAPEGGAFGKEVPNLGDYSEHSYRVMSNYTRD